MRNQTSSGRAVRSTAKSKKASALATSTPTEETADTPDNSTQDLKVEEQNGQITDLDGPTLIVSDEDKSKDSKTLQVNGTDRTSVGPAKSPTPVETAKKNVADTIAQVSRVERSVSRGSHTPALQVNETANNSQLEKPTEAANGPPRTLTQLQEYAVYSVELLQKHGSEIDRLLEAVDRIEDIQDDLRFSMKDTRIRLQRLERKSARATTPEPYVDPEEIDVLATSISQISNKVNEIDTLKLALDLFKSRIKRLETSNARQTRESSVERSPSPITLSRDPSEQVEERTSESKLKRKRDKTISEIDEEEEYASMIEDMRHKRLPKRNNVSSHREHVKPYASQPPHSPSRASKVVPDRASSLPSKPSQSHPRSRGSPLLRKKLRHTGPVRIPKRPSILSQTSYRSEPDVPKLGIEEEDTWDPLADGEDDGEPHFRAFPAKARENNTGDLRDLRLKNMANKLQKGRAHDDFHSSFSSVTRKKTNALGLSEPDPDTKEQERVRREDRDREASVAMRLDGIDEV